MRDSRAIALSSRGLSGEDPGYAELARLEASLRVICETKVLPFDQQADWPPGDGAAEQPRILDNSPKHLPIIDVGPLIAGTDERCTVAAQIGKACRKDSKT